MNRALVELQRRGILKCVISQNCDGLHLRSGINPNHLAELHGNINLETCKKCHAKYLRDFDTDSDRDNHYTGRRCDKPECRGRLKDSIINFGEDLPEDELNKAFDHAEKTDLCLVLGRRFSFTSLPY
jgi:NAD-dependent SIR2 family protein deacetylase